VKGGPVFALVLCRVLHVAAACSSFGGLLYARVVMWPSVGRLPAAQRAETLAAAMRRFAWIKWSGVAVVALTGIVQWCRVDPVVRGRSDYLAWFGVKMGAALGLVAVTALLALPLPMLRGMHRRRALWSALNLVFAALILTGAAMMHASRGSP
jgi:uncharacterized membrane protein